jgi:hypothetical protein
MLQQTTSFLGVLLLSTSVARGELATLSGSFNVNPAAVGQPIELTVTDSTGLGFEIHHSSCYGRTIRAGSPDGPIVYSIELLSQPEICTQDIVTIPPFGSFTIRWSQHDLNGQQVAPGLYYFQVGSNGSLNYFPIEIRPQEPGDPASGAWRRLPARNTTLTQTSTSRVGRPLQLDLSSPRNAAEPYLVAFSFTTNQGFHHGNAFSSLDPDLLLLASVRSFQAAPFENTVGLLDGRGRASGITLRIPNLSILEYQGLASQAFVIKGSTLSLSNPLVFTVQP